MNDSTPSIQRHASGGIAINAAELIWRREQKFWNRRELSTRAAMSLSSLRKIESGESWPRITTLGRICEALGCDLADLLPAREENEQEASLSRLPAAAAPCPGKHQEHP